MHVPPVFRCWTIQNSSNRIPHLMPAIPISALTARSSFTNSKPRLGMRPLKTLIFNICRTNFNGPQCPQSRSNGRSSNFHFDASTARNARHLRNSYMNGSRCRTATKSTVRPLIIHAHLATVPPKHLHISSHVLTLTIKLYGQNSTTNYSNTTCIIKSSQLIMISTNTN